MFQSQVKHCVVYTYAYQFTYYEIAENMCGTQKSIVTIIQNGCNCY
jgi:hypothetical protein